MSAEDKEPSESGQASAEISEWLVQIGCGRYAPAFAANAITLSVLAELTDADLREIGVLLGDRKLMLREIANLRNAPATTAPAPAAVAVTVTKPVSPPPEPVSAPPVAAPVSPPPEPLPEPLVTERVAPPKPLPEPPFTEPAPPPPEPLFAPPVQPPARPLADPPRAIPETPPDLRPGAGAAVQPRSHQAPYQAPPPPSASPKNLSVDGASATHPLATIMAEAPKPQAQGMRRDQTPEPSKSHFDRFLRPILASRFLTISALIHLIIILLFGGKVVFDKYVEPPDFQSTGGDMISTDTAPEPPDQKPEETLPPPAAVAAPPPPSAPTAATMATLTTLNPNAAAFSMPLPAIVPATISNSLASQPQAQAQGQASGNGAPVALPSAMSGRPGGGGSGGGVGASYGDTPAAEQSVLRALRWLQTQQKSDGTWGSPGYHDAFTGLALLCYLGHGETPKSSHEFGVVVANAINALVTEGNADQDRFSGEATFSGNPAAYQHAICTYALSEAYAMTKDERLAPVLKQAVDYIVKGQRPDGGWAYGYDLTPNGNRSDTSVSGWQIQALKAAHLTGLPGMDDQNLGPVLNNAMRNLDRVFDPQNGTFGYRNAGDKGNNYGLTGVGVLCKLFWTGRADRTVREGLKDITSKDLDYTGPDCNLYAWYYDAQACFQAQGESWDWWNHRFQSQLTSNQSADGSWPVPPKGVDPTAGLGTSPGGDGPLYRTTLCCLMLEVFYRYLPTSNESTNGGGVDGL